MKIHGIVYIIIGGFLVGFSYYVTSVNERINMDKFMLFVWVGGAFISIGLIKLILGLLSKPKKRKVAKENFAHHTPKHNKELYHQSVQGNQFVKFCSNCGNPVRHFDNFCYKCGNRMFHRR